jgi:hypothetical protein
VQAGTDELTVGFDGVEEADSIEDVSLPIFVNGDRVGEIYFHANGAPTLTVYRRP